MIMWKPACSSFVLADVRPETWVFCYFKMNLKSYIQGTSLQHLHWYPQVSFIWYELHELQFFKLAEIGRQRMLVEFYLIYVDVEETVLKMYQMAEIRCNSFTEISDTGASQAGTSDTNTSDIGTSHWRIFQFSDLPLCCYCCGTKSKTVGGKVSNIFSEHFVSKRFVSKHSSRTLSKFSCITSIKRF